VRRALPIVLGVLVVAAVVIGLNQASDKGGAKEGPAFDLPAALADLKGSPPALAALHRQAGRLLDGGAPAFKARLKGLRGHPVVINKWGSWCGPCRTEFPVFQRVGAKQGATVAFLGIDGHDNRSDAQDFLREFPTTYPSYADPDELIARAVGAPANYPITVFVDERGETAFVHQGQYRSDAELQADIRRYLGA
jgi:cytochrome c biogenesis protein CcmG/thiol:disulfide interchange protein DsbE